MQTTSGSSVFLFDASGQQIAVPSGTTAYLEQQNWLGTDRLRTDSLGHVATTETSLAFGDGFNQSVLENNGGLDNNQFAGQDYDAESSTQHAQFRQYSSTQGRWMSPDPYDGSYDFTNPQSLNRYAYALNNPLSLIDPSGLDEEGDDDGGDDGGGGSDQGCTSSVLQPLANALDDILNQIGQMGEAIGGAASSIGNAIGSAGSALGSLFGGDGPGGMLGPSDGMYGGPGGPSQPSGIPMTLGYQNIARPAQQQTQGGGNTPTPNNSRMDFVLYNGFPPKAESTTGIVWWTIMAVKADGSLQLPDYTWRQKNRDIPVDLIEDQGKGFKPQGSHPGQGKDTIWVSPGTSYLQKWFVDHQQVRVVIGGSMAKPQMGWTIRMTQTWAGPVYSLP